MLLTSFLPRSTLSDFFCIYFHKKIKIRSVIIISIERKTTAEELSYCTCAKVNTGVTSISIKNTKDVNITKNLSQNYFSIDYHTTRELYQSKIVLNILFIPCEKFPEPVLP